MRPRKIRKPFPAVVAVEVDLIGLAREPIATVRLVIAGLDDYPLLVMFDGEPFLYEGHKVLRKTMDAAVYVKARPYRVESSMVLR